MVSALSQKHLKSQRREDSYLELLRRSRERALALGEIGRANDSPLLLELGAILLRDNGLEAGAARALVVMERRARKKGITSYTVKTFPLKTSTWMI